MFFFFFKQKTAYEISTRDWSSDVCSSDLQGGVHPRLFRSGRRRHGAHQGCDRNARIGRGRVIMALAEVLPPVNATLNATSAILLFVGYRAIRTKRVALHRFVMQAAFVTSTIFLVCYLTRFYLTG